MSEPNEPNAELLKQPLSEVLTKLLDRISAKDQHIAAMENEIERLEKARERADEAGVTDMRAERERRDRLEKDLAESEQARKRYDTLVVLIEEAKRSVELDDKRGAAACLGAVIDTLLAGGKPSIDKLRPCPFCGGTAERYYAMGGQLTGWAVRCLECGAQTKVDLQEPLKGVQWWNSTARIAGY